MKALTIWQPWAWLIIRPDITDSGERLAAMAHGEIKDIENRTWIPREGATFDLLIHAGKSIDYEAWEWVRERFPGIVMPEPEGIDRGGIIGRVIYTGWTDRKFATGMPWFVGPYGWVLRSPVALPFTPLRGQQGLFDVNADGIG